MMGRSLEMHDLQEKKIAIIQNYPASIMKPIYITIFHFILKYYLWFKIFNNDLQYLMVLYIHHGPCEWVIIDKNKFYKFCHNVKMTTLKCLSIGTPNIINFPFVSNRKLMFLGVPIFKHIVLRLYSA